MNHNIGGTTKEEAGRHRCSSDGWAAPIFITWVDPDDARYAFEPFYAAMRRHGFTIFPGRTTAAGTFRIGCMGDLTPERMAEVAHAVVESMDELGVKHRGPTSDRVMPGR
jgi:2-aminoethylphosphonate-pyruvate transaminase